MLFRLSLCFPRGISGQGSNAIMLCPNQIMVNHPDTHTCHTESQPRNEKKREGWMGGGDKTTLHFYIVQT